MKHSSHMYIGPWQEYKLARLIQASHERNEPSSRRTPTGLPRQSSIDRLHKGGCADSLDRLETNSVASSTRSGLSSRSAPPRLTPQSRLNDMFQDAAHAGRVRTPSSASAASSAGRPPRPSSSTGSRRGPGGRPPAARKAAVSKRVGAPKPSAEEERRARIAHMQQLYGLGVASARDDDSQGTAPDASQVTTPAAISNIEQTVGNAAARGWIPQQEMHELRSGISSSTSVTSVHCAEVMNPRAAVPLNTTLDGADEHEDDLIAWSKMLKPENLSSEVDLSCLLPPP